jgi:hypothetical protein
MATRVAEKYNITSSNYVPVTAPWKLDIVSPKRKVETANSVLALVKIKNMRSATVQDDVVEFYNLGIAYFP